MAPPSPLLTVPNVTTHPSTASVCTNHCTAIWCSVALRFYCGDESVNVCIMFMAPQCCAAEALCFHLVRRVVRPDDCLGPTSARLQSRTESTRTSTLPSWRIHSCANMDSPAGGRVHSRAKMGGLVHYTDSAAGASMTAGGRAVARFLPRDAMPSCGVCVCLSRSWILSKRVIVSLDFFHHRVHHHPSFSIPSGMAIFRRGPP